MPPTRLADGLFGRDRELAELAAVMADVRAGRRVVSLVEGEAGMGKTALVRAALGAETAVVVWAGGDEAEVEVDHGVIEQLVRAAPLDDPIRADLLASVGGDPLRTGAALVRLVDGLEINPLNPLVVVVDDAQWADAPSLRALTFAARRLQRDPLLLCLTARSSELDRMPEGLLRLVDDEGVRVHVGPLDRTAVRHLAAQVTGQAIGTHAADRLLEHTRGSPLHLRTLLDELPSSAITAAADLPAPRSFSTLVLSRLATASPAVVSLVSAVAILGDPTALRTAARVAEVDDPLPVLDAAVATGLLQVVDPAEPGGALQVATPHPLVRAALLGDLPVARKGELHRRAGALLGGTAGLRHRMLGAADGDRELWAEAAAAADEAASHGAYGSAAGLLRQSIAVATSQEDRDLSVLEATDHLLLAGRLGDAMQLRPAVLAATESPRRSYVMGRLAYTVGPRREARAHLDDAWRRVVGEVGGEPKLRRLPAGVRDLAGRIAAMQATLCVDRAEGEAAIAWCRWAQELAPEQATRSSAAHMLAAGYSLAGQIEQGLAELDELCAALQVDGGLRPQGPAVADAHSARGLLRLWSHDLEGAGRDLEISLDAADEGGSFVARETARFYLAEVRYRQGRWREALLLAQLSASVVDDSDQAWMAALPHATIARPLAASGDETADEHLDRAMAAAAAIGGGVGRALSQVAALEVAACRRDLATVLEVGRWLSSGRRRVDERVAPWRATYVEALAADGQVALAEQIAAELRSEPDTALVRNDAARAAVAVALAGGDPVALDAAGEAGLAVPAADVGPYPRARLELAVGRAWRRRGERRRAVAVLEAARARFEALGARPWIEQVEREITGSGLHPVRRHAPPGAELTPQEQAVAELVGRGLTNRETAAELVVSAKTVEHHLSRIYAKLGVRSRTELAARLTTP